VPRIGTVVSGVSRRPPLKGRDAELSRERIVASAVAIADSEGIGALSLRRVAAALDAPVMSLYRHVDGKDELVRAMIDAALSAEVLPDVPPDGWRAQLEVAARAHWRMLRRHPWLARSMSITRPTPLPSAAAHAEWVLRALEGHGLDAAERMRMHVMLHNLVQGIAVNLETEAEAASDTGLTDDEWMAKQMAGFEGLAASGRYPAFAAVLSELAGGFDLDFDVLFELGLGALLDGYARIIERARGSRSRGGDRDVDVSARRAPASAPARARRGGRSARAR
jgi:AcrR family transcriptional regulator